MGLWSFWYGVSGVGAVADNGGNIGAGFSWDSDIGDGLYFTAGETQGLAAAAGGEVGIYTGSIYGKTTIVTAGVGPFSIGLVFGDGSNIFGFNLGTVFGYSPYGVPLEASISNNTTWSTSQLPSPCP